MFDHISGYKFIELTELPTLQTQLQVLCERLELLGTVLLSPEGINVMLAGTQQHIEIFEQTLKQDHRFADCWFKHSYSFIKPFHELKIKIKAEIITFGVPQANPNHRRGQYITPKELQRWYEQQRDFIVLDTRNHFEYRFGAFDRAQSLNLKSFSELPTLLAAEPLAKHKPVVTYCTGGVRCEKAALLLEHDGFTEVYQLEGGILNYFAQCGGAHYHGECFVFDDRIAVDAKLAPTGTVQCKNCFGPVTREQQQSLDYVAGQVCPSCLSSPSSGDNHVVCAC